MSIDNTAHRYHAAIRQLADAIETHCTHPVAGSCATCAAQPVCQEDLTRKIDRLFGIVWDLAYEEQASAAVQGAGRPVVSLQEISASRDALDRLSVVIIDCARISPASSIRDAAVALRPLMG